MESQFSRFDRLDIDGYRTLYLGSHPFEGLPPQATRETQCERFSAYLARIAEEGIETVVVLLPEDELERVSQDCDILGRYRDAGLSILHYPLENLSVPDALDKFDAFIRELLEGLKSRRTLIHCLAGCGRTGMVASGVLVRLGARTADAIEKINRTREGTTHTMKQILFLKEYAAWLARH